jgi:hypothetical protein
MLSYPVTESRLMKPSLYDDERFYDDEDYNRAKRKRGPNTTKERTTISE